MNGYQGFKSFEVQVCPTLKPGESYESRGNKFSKVGNYMITPTTVNTRLGSHAFSSIAQHSGSFVQPKDYTVPLKSGPIQQSVSSSQCYNKPFIGVTMYQQDFVAHGNEIERILAVPIVNYGGAFNNINSSENSNEKSITREQIGFVIREALGGPICPQLTRIVENIIEKQQLKNPVPGGRVPWPNFQSALEQALDVIQKQLPQGNQHTQESYASGNFHKNKLLSTPKIPWTTHPSSYQTDYGKYGSEPLARPYTSKKVMASTTMDILPGTTKHTFHVPGYTGFIPMTKHNLHAVVHGEGETLRPVKADLKFYVTEHLPGYTGHKPMDCMNIKHDSRYDKKSQ